MKKIIVAALSILVGACGYTIVDKEINDRVASLEASASAYSEELSAVNSRLYDLENYTNEYYVPTITTNTTNTTKSNSEFEIGDNFPIGKNQQRSFKIAELCFEQFYEGEKFNYTVYKDYGFGYNLADYDGELISTQYYDVSISDLNIIVVDTSTKTETLSSNYTTSEVNKKSLKIKIEFNGATDPKFAGKYISFNVNWLRNTAGYYIANSRISALVSKDGTFAVSETISDCYNEDLTPLSVEFNDVSISVYRDVYGEEKTYTNQ